MVKAKDQEKIAIGKVEWYTHGANMSEHAQPSLIPSGGEVHEEPPGSVRRQRKREQLWAAALIVVPLGRNRRARRGEV